MVENVCKQLKLCIQLDKMPDSLNIKFTDEHLISQMLSQILDFFCNFFNIDDITQIFAYLGSYGSSKSICIGYFIHSGSSGNVTFWHPL